jgi:hypothetical protein
MLTKIAKHHKKAAKHERAAHHTKHPRATRPAQPKQPAAQEDQVFAVAAVEEQGLPPFAGQFFEAFEVEAEPPVIEVVELEDWQL